MKALKRFFVRLYRTHWQFPRHWAPFGWKVEEMTDWYWRGSTDLNEPRMGKL